MKLFVNLLRGIAYRVRRALSRRTRPKCGKNCQIHPTAMFNGFVENITIGDNVKIGAYAEVTCQYRATIDIGSNCSISPFSVIHTGKKGGSVKLGKNCSVNHFCVLYGHGGLEIGDNVRIATQTVFIPANHRFDRIDQTITEQGLDMKGIRVGDDVWFGVGVRVLDGIEIGSGSVIGANSVVTSSIPELTVALGTPARAVKRRGEKPGEQPGVDDA